MRSFELGSVRNRLPFRGIMEFSVKRYSKTIRSLLIFATKLAQDVTVPAGLPLVLEENVRAAASAFSQDPTSGTAASLLHELFTSACPDRTVGVIAWFSRLFAFSSGRFKFKAVSNTVVHLIYGIRSLVAKAVINKLPDATGLYDLIKFPSSSRTPFHHLVNLSFLAKHMESVRSGPSVFTSICADRLVLAEGGQIIERLDLEQLVRYHLSRAQTIMEVLTSGVCLPDLVRSTTTTSTSQRAKQNPEPNLHYAAMVLQAAIGVSLDGPGPGDYSPEQRAAAAVYLDNVSKFKTSLLVLVHVLGGQPARIPELLRATFHGDEPTMDVLPDGTTCLHQRYHKSLAVTGKEVDVYRFLPPTVTSIALRYEVVVRPVEEVILFTLHGMRDGVLDRMDRSLFSVKGAPMTPDDACHRFNLATLSVKMNMTSSQYRHVAIYYGRHLYVCTFKKKHYFRVDYFDRISTNTFTPIIAS